MKFKNLLFSGMLFLVCFFASTNIYAQGYEDLSFGNLNYTEQEQSIHKYNGDFIVEDNKISIKNLSNLSIEDIEEVDLLLKDLNLLNEYGNIYLKENGSIAFRNIDEITKFKSDESNNNYNIDISKSDNEIVPFYDPDAPPFNLELTVRANTQYLQNYYNDLMDLMIKYPHMTIMPALQTDIEFASKVAEKQPWDYKRVIGWNNYRTCIINGKIYALTGEDIGNIHYAYVGRSRGFSTTTLCKAGGLVQTLTSKGANLFQFSYDSYYDDPNDQVAIRRGASWYDTGILK